MKKKLIALLFSGMLGIIPVGCVFAEELSSVDEISEIKETTQEDVLSAGEAEENLLENEEDIPPVEDTYSGTWGTCEWDINSDGVLTIHAGIGENHTGSYDASIWQQYRDNINSIVAEKGVVLPNDSSSLFYNLNNCTSIDLSLADTSNVINMAYMFSHCSSLTNLDLSNFDTPT